MGCPPWVQDFMGKGTGKGNFTHRLPVPFTSSVFHTVFKSTSSTLTFPCQDLGFT